MRPGFRDCGGVTKHVRVPASGWRLHDFDAIRAIVSEGGPRSPGINRGGQQVVAVIQEGVAGGVRPDQLGQVAASIHREGGDLSGRILDPLHVGRAVIGECRLVRQRVLDRLQEAGRACERPASAGNAPHAGEVAGGVVLVLETAGFRLGPTAITVLDQLVGPQPAPGSGCCRPCPYSQTATRHHGSPSPQWC